jgi:hypothetical protein
MLQASPERGGGKGEGPIRGSLRIDGKLDFVRFDDSVVASINIEIADMPETQTKGLMGRSSLDYNNGTEGYREDLFLFFDIILSLTRLSHCPTFLKQL